MLSSCNSDLQGPREGSHILDALLSAELTLLLMWQNYIRFANEFSLCVSLL